MKRGELIYNCSGLCSAMEQSVRCQSATSTSMPRRHFLTDLDRAAELLEGTGLRAVSQGGRKGGRGAVLH
jgi:hypothetical protein